MQGQPPCSKLCKPSFFSSSWTMASVFSHLERWPAALAAGSELAKTCCTTKRTTLHHVIGIPWYPMVSRYPRHFAVPMENSLKPACSTQGLKLVPGFTPVSQSVSGKPYRLPIATGHMTAIWVHPRIWVSMWCELGALFWHWQVWVPTLITWIFLPWWCCAVKPCQQRFCQSICICSIHLIGCLDFEQTGNGTTWENHGETRRTNLQHISTFLASDM